jgi:60 kDa SS-A/Ro ribonucleoprotein
VTKDALGQITSRTTPQSRPADARQVRNSAGGYTFELDDLARLRRFLVLGVDGGTYYASDHELAIDNADVVRRLAAHRHRELVDTIIEVSESGRAPKQKPALLAYAMAASYGSADERRYAWDRLRRVARTGTHLLIFVRYMKQFRGWGRQACRGVSEWFTEPSAVDVAYQVTKYRQREGFSQRDLLRLAHPRAKEYGGDPQRRALMHWVAHRHKHTATEWQVLMTEYHLPLVEAFEVAQSTDRVGDWISAVGQGLSWEMLPDAALGHREVWEALLNRGMPQTALMRQLPRLTRLGLFDGATRGRTSWTQRVATQLADADRLVKARVHPLNVLIALRTYAAGRSERGSSRWTPNQRIVDALDSAFYAAFGAVEPTHQRIMLALDISGSMTWHNCAGVPITPREASAALALVTAAVEPNHTIVCFHSATGYATRSWASRTVSSNDFGSGIEPIPISPRQRLDDVLRTITRLHAGDTDLALPMLYAEANQLEVDTFVIYTDNETWAGRTHPHEALRRYRQRMGIPARLIVVGMTSTGFTIADPSDPGMLDVVGFDTATPGLITDFSRGVL